MLQRALFQGVEMTELPFTSSHYQSNGAGERISG